MFLVVTEARLLSILCSTLVADECKSVTYLIAPQDLRYHLQFHPKFHLKFQKDVVCKYNYTLSSSHQNFLKGQLY